MDASQSKKATRRPPTTRRTRYLSHKLESGKITFFFLTQTWDPSPSHAFLPGHRNGGTPDNEPGFPPRAPKRLNKNPTRRGERLPVTVLYLSQISHPPHIIRTAAATAAALLQPPSLRACTLRSRPAVLLATRRGSELASPDPAARAPSPRPRTCRSWTPVPAALRARALFLSLAGGGTAGEPSHSAAPRAAGPAAPAQGGWSRVGCGEALTWTGRNQRTKEASGVAASLRLVSCYLFGTSPSFPTVGFDLSVPYRPIGDGVAGVRGG